MTDSLLCKKTYIGNKDYDYELKKGEMNSIQFKSKGKKDKLNPLILILILIPIWPRPPPLLAPPTWSRVRSPAADWLTARHVTSRDPARDLA